MARTIIDGYVIDCTVREVPTLNSEATEFPVEEGPDLTDHIRQLPIELEIEGIVTDTPTGGMLTIRDDLGSSDVGGGGQVIGPELPPDAQVPSRTALAHLERIRTNRRPITIQTSRRLYERMAMTAFSPPVDKATGKALKFTATFKQIKIIRNERSIVRTTPRNQGVGQGGAKPGDNKESSRIIVFTLRKKISTPVELGGPAVPETGLKSYIAPNGAGGALTEEPILKNGLTHHFRARAGDKADGYVELGTARTPGIPYGGGRYTPYGMEIQMPTTSKDSIQANADQQRQIVQANQNNQKLWKEMQGQQVFNRNRN